MSAAESAPGPVVCHLVERLEYGGAETLVRRFANRLREAGYVPIVCCLHGGAVARELERDGITVRYLNVRRRSVLGGPAFAIFVARLLTRLVKVLRNDHVAILHAHLQDPTMWAVAASAFTRVPVVATYHGLGIMPKGRLRIDPRNAARRALYRFAGRRAACTIAVSQPVLTLLHDMGVDRHKTILIQNGVETDAFADAVPGAGLRQELDVADRTVILCVGRLVAEKGQRFLVEAMPHIVARHPDAVLVLVGAGPDRGALHDYAQQLNIDRDVRIVAPRDDVPGLLALSSVFVLPSFSEGIPLALIEAMAAGKPVVATTVPGNLDVVVDGRYGVLVPARDARALAEAVCTLLDDPHDAGCIALRGQQHVRAHFDIGRCIGELVTLYDRLLAEPGQRELR
jgi:glycosyltransferase involved in cell wall biosynthesis